MDHQLGITWIPMDPMGFPPKTSKTRSIPSVEVVAPQMTVTSALASWATFEAT